MVLIPRSPSVQNVQCKHDELSGTAEAGAIVYLSGDKKIAKVAASGNVPFGLLGQRVKAYAAGLPQGFRFPGELGTSDCYLGDPVLLFHMGTFETTHYLLPAGVAAGAPLFAKVGDVNNNSKLIAVTSGCALDVNGNPAVVAIAESALSAGDAAANKPLAVKMLI